MAELWPKTLNFPNHGFHESVTILHQQFRPWYGNHQNTVKNLADRRIPEAGDIRKRATVPNLTVAVLVGAF
jgi:hypothetical protein